MIFNEFKDKWNQIMPNNNGFLSLGIDHPLDFQIGYYTSQFKSLIVMNTGKVSEIPSSKAIKASNVQLVNGTWILQFQLLHTAYEEQFLRLCWDIIESTSVSSNPLRDLIARYISWQKLLQYAKDEVLSFSMQKGLIGELLFLNKCIEGYGEEHAVNAWVGPEGSDQDFIFESTWAEVKSVALSADKIKISSMEQLQQSIDGTLEVFVLEKTTPGNERITLYRVVSSIRDRLKAFPQALDRFEMKLYKYGFRDDDKVAYDQNQFRFIEQRSYKINSDFPRITKENVASQIIECTYAISLSAIENFRR